MPTAPETKDNNFTWKDFQARNNNELVAVYGNFVNRALQLTKKYYDGIVPACGELNDTDRATIDEFKNVKADVERLLDGFRFRDAQKEAMNLARIGNKYLADAEPWKVIKTDPERVKTIINLSLQLVANLAIAFEPFLPFSSDRLRKMIGLDTFDWNQLGATDLLQTSLRPCAPSSAPSAATATAATCVGAIPKGYGSSVKMWTCSSSISAAIRATMTARSSVRSWLCRPNFS